jgi:hypothetical protein
MRETWKWFIALLLRDLRALRGERTVKLTPMDLDQESRISLWMQAPAPDSDPGFTGMAEHSIVTIVCETVPNNDPLITVAADQVQLVFPKKRVSSHRSFRFNGLWKSAGCFDQ